MQLRHVGTVLLGARVARNMHASTSFSIHGNFIMRYLFHRVVVRNANFLSVTAVRDIFIFWPVLTLAVEVREECVVCCVLCVMCCVLCVVYCVFCSVCCVCVDFRSLEDFLEGVLRGSLRVSWGERAHKDPKTPKGPPRDIQEPPKTFSGAPKKPQEAPNKF